MDSTDTSIKFDDRGICDHCNTFFNHTLPAWNLQKGNKKEVFKILKSLVPEWHH